MIRYALLAAPPIITVTVYAQKIAVLEVATRWKTGAANAASILPFNGSPKRNTS